MYVYGVLWSWFVRVLCLFFIVLFCMLFLLCGLVKLGIGFSYWIDIVVGFVSGLFIVVYLVIFDILG